MAGRDNKGVTLFQENESAEGLGVKKLAMGVWYNRSVPEDRAFGEELMEAMTTLGCQTTKGGVLKLSPEGLLGGQEIKLATEHLFEKADIVHVVFSRKSMETDDQAYIRGLKGLKEANEGKLDDSTFIVPVLINETEVPSMFKGKQPLKLYGEHRATAGQKLTQTWQYAASKKK